MFKVPRQVSRHLSSRLLQLCLILSTFTNATAPIHHLYADDTQLFISFSPASFFHLNCPSTLGCKPNLSMNVIQPTLPQPFQNRIHHNRPTCPNQENP